MPDRERIDAVLADGAVVEVDYRRSLADHERVTLQRKLAILRAVDTGATYEEIGETFGCSKQYVSKLVTTR